MTKFTECDLKWICTCAGAVGYLRAGQRRTSLLNTILILRSCLQFITVNQMGRVTAVLHSFVSFSFSIRRLSSSRSIMKIISTAYKFYDLSYFEQKTVITIIWLKFILTWSQCWFQRHVLWLPASRDAISPTHLRPATWREGRWVYLIWFLFSTSVLSGTSLSLLPLPRRDKPFISSLSH